MQNCCDQCGYLSCAPLILIKFARKNENLIITPHIGGACNDAMDLVENFIINKLLKILEFDNR